MSYDIRIGVKVDGTDIIVPVARPERDSPTYNLRTMFVKCMGWDYEQGKWYRLKDVDGKISLGLAELNYKRAKYEKYNSPNGWGTVDSAKECLQSIVECIEEMTETVPIEHLWFRW